MPRLSAQRSAKLEILRAARDRSRDPEIVRLETPRHDSAGARCLEPDESLAPAAGEYGGRFDNALDTDPERGVKHRCLADRSVEKIGEMPFSVADGSDVRFLRV
jgi:hypothetical protein